MVFFRRILSLQQWCRQKVLGPMQWIRQENTGTSCNFSSRRIQDSMRWCVQENTETSCNYARKRIQDPHGIMLTGDYRAPMVLCWQENTGQGPHCIMCTGYRARMVWCGQDTGPPWYDVDRRIRGPHGMMWTGECRAPMGWCVQKHTGHPWDDVERRIQGPNWMMWTGE